MRHPLAKHPLAGACARVERAGKHFKELEALIKCFRLKNEQEFISQHNHAAIKVRSTLSLRSKAHTKFGPVETDIAVILGDVMHNLRAALDYLIYELAFTDSGIEHQGTQFLIEDSKTDTKDANGEVIKRGFNYLAKKRLAGLNPTHIRAIEALQPYNGVTWTKTLRAISNPDKHRKLTVIAGGGQGSYLTEGGKPGSFKGRPGKVFAGIGVDGADIYVEGEYSVRVELPDGTPLVKTLEILEREVRATIDAFKPEFK